MEKKKRKKRIRILKSLVLVCAFVIAIGATFGMTMAYFGGSSNAQTGTMTLKTGVWVNATDISTSLETYVVPSQIVSPTCEVKVKSSKYSDGVANTTSGSNALLRAKITLAQVVEDGEESTITLDELPAVFEVTVGEDTAYLTKHHTDGYYYLMENNLITLDEGTGKNETSLTTSETASELMYVINSSGGEVTLSYKLSIQIPVDLDNTFGGEQIELTITYDVIQADFYATSSTAVTKTVDNADDIFNLVKDANASYNAHKTPQS